METNEVSWVRWCIVGTCMLLVQNVNANELQTTFGVQYTVPKVVQQFANEQVSVASQDITVYGRVQNANLSQVDHRAADTLDLEQNPFFMVPATTMWKADCSIWARGIIRQN